MTWTEIKKWAKEKGYESKKTDGVYIWSKIDDPSISGQSPSVSKLARSIYNHMTNNLWIEHQNSYNV